MTSIHVVYGLSSEAHRRIAFAFRLANALRAPLLVWIPSDATERVTFMALHATAPDSLEEGLIRRQLQKMMRDMEVVLEPELGRGDPWKTHSDAGAILVGSYRQQAQGGAAAIATMGEYHLLERGPGPICVPFGRSEACHRAAAISLPLARTLGLSVVFYHATWLHEGDDARISAERHMQPDVGDNLRRLREQAEAIGVSHETMIETEKAAPTIAQGVADFAVHRGCVLIAMARGDKVGGGSNADKVMKRTATPVLIAGRSVS